MLEKAMDARMIRSRAAIIQAIASLLDDRDVADITITDVVKAAEVTRPTYYQHFPDIAAGVCAGLCPA
jgi:AcrR family transcriptional regulator